LVSLWIDLKYTDGVICCKPPSIEKFIHKPIDPLFSLGFPRYPLPLFFYDPTVILKDFLGEISGIPEDQRQWGTFDGTPNDIPY